MKRHLNFRTLTIVLAVVVLIQAVVMVAVVHKLHIDSIPVGVEQQLTQLQADTATAAGAASFTTPIASISDNKVYLPDIGLVLPLDYTSLDIRYDHRQVGNPSKSLQTTYDVTTQTLASQPANGMPVIDCTPVVRFSFEDKANPFNPHERTNPAVHLADGRTLQIYTADEPSCKTAWQQAGVVPSTIAAELAKAQSFRISADSGI